LGAAVVQQQRMTLQPACCCTMRMALQQQQQRMTLQPACCRTMQSAEAALKVSHMIDKTNLAHCGLWSRFEGLSRFFPGYLPPTFSWTAAALTCWPVLFDL
jgi:hypothetical protein